MSALRLRSLSVEAWAAWAPGLERREDWESVLRAGGPLPADGPPPSLSGVASKLRRRMSPLGKMVCEAGLRCLKDAGLPPSGPALVYCTRHGELGLISGLLGSLSKGEPLSPAAFANSVDHAGAGHFGIAADNRRRSRTILGGADSFACGWLEASCLLAERSKEPVLLVAADAAAPAPFDRLAGRWPPYAAALLLRPASGSGVRWEREPLSGDAVTARLPQALEFLAWLLSGEPSLRLRGEREVWTWSR